MPANIIKNTNFLINGTPLTSTTVVDKTYLLDHYEILKNSIKSPRMYIWGYNLNGQLGDNTRTNASSPIQTISAGTGWKSLLVGGNYFKGAIKTDGTLWTWGINAQGTLGDSTLLAKSSPVQVGLLTNWKQLAGGYAHMVALRTDGTVWAWGYNNYGQLGPGITGGTRQSSPIQVGALTTWKQVSAGSANSGAIRQDGTLWLWGSNTGGQLGDNSRVQKSSPVQTTTGGSNWKQLSAGYTTAAIKNDGTLWMWGYNSYGQLGVNDPNTARSTPVQVANGGTNWKQVSVSPGNARNITAAIKTDGTLWAWGYNVTGNLGIGTNTSNVSTPVQIAGGGTSWHRVAAGTGASGAIKTDGTLWMWGNTNVGQLGDGTATAKSSPVQIGTSTGWKAISGGYTFSAIFDDSVDFGVGKI